MNENEFDPFYYQLFYYVAEGDLQSLQILLQSVEDINSIYYSQITLLSQAILCEKIEIITSSLRIDTIIARLIQTSRANVIEKMKNKEIILNYDLLKNNSYQLKENDVFSIRHHGKYKYIKTINQTKNNNYIVECYKYI